MTRHPVTYVPGLHRIFDEVLLYAAETMQMDVLHVDIDVSDCRISVYNNGEGIPVELHQEEGVYLPEIIFGHLVTTTNYDDTLNIKLAKVFSTEFIV
ncbi:hypothetical protein E2562_024284 [Oryza meyeriana var. granulata]|uniref:DNA topoisomerase (ATP-hydrolyzing) n=1 Tax=Oryza meyeriana var. granulata TaxID=110450 RepID=A0A6G1C886_9ORYZ|nr:hypothetical protein E2562_024284 [Oryza meyeriana var. granulata]